MRYFCFEKHSLKIDCGQLFKEIAERFYELKLYVSDPFWTIYVPQME